MKPKDALNIKIRGLHFEQKLFFYSEIDGLCGKLGRILIVTGPHSINMFNK